MSNWHPKEETLRKYRKLSNEDRATILEMYKGGKSTRDIGAIFGSSFAYIHRLVQRAGLTRSRRDAALLKVKPVISTHWRTCRGRARKILAKQLGRALRSDEHVHHINEDYTDNRVENLQIVNPREHGHIHHPPNPIPRWKRPARMAYINKLKRELRKRRKAESEKLV